MHTCYIYRHDVIMTASIMLLIQLNNTGTSAFISVTDPELFFPQVPLSFQDTRRFFSQRKQHCTWKVKSRTGIRDEGIFFNMISI